MKRFALLLLFALSLPITASADDATKRAKVHEMLDLLHMDRMMSQIMDSVMKQVSSMSSQMSGKELSPDQKAMFDAFQKQVFETIDAKAGWKAMEPEYIDLYAQTYTEDELDAIIAFYKSPAGQSMIAKTPELTQKTMAIAQQKIIALQPQLQQMVRDFARQAAAKSASAPINRN